MIGPGHVEEGADGACSLYALRVLRRRWEFTVEMQHLFSVPGWPKIEWGDRVDGVGDIVVGMGTFPIGPGSGVQQPT